MLYWATSWAPVTSHVRVELYWHNLPDASHLANRNFPFTPVSVTLALWLREKTQQHWKTLSTFWNTKESNCDFPQIWGTGVQSVYPGKTTFSKPQHPLRYGISRRSVTWAEAGPSPSAQFCLYWGPLETRHCHHQLGPFQLLTFILCDQIIPMCWSLCSLSTSLRSINAMTVTANLFYPRWIPTCLRHQSTWMEIYLLLPFKTNTI